MKLLLFVSPFLALASGAFENNTILLSEGPRQEVLAHLDTATVLQLRQADTVWKTFASKELSDRSIMVYTKLNGKGLWHKKRNTKTFVPLNNMLNFQYRTNVSPRIIEKKEGFSIMNDFEVFDDTW